MGRILEADIETFSDVDLIKCGVYAYADSPAFEILLFAYSFDGGETQIIDLAQGEKFPAEVEEAIFDVSVTKTAYNANFERTCLSKYFGRYIPPESWHCSAVQAAMLALPRSLEDVGRVLGLDEQKMKEGKELIRYFCVPCKPTKANGGRTRNLPCHAPEKWELFKTYCKRDVDVEKSIRRKLHNFPIPESEMELYRLDQRINDRGVLVDMGLVKQAIACERLHKEIVTKRAYELTGLEKGAVETEDEKTAELVTAGLTEQGFIGEPQPEADETAVSIPVEGMTAEGLKNLIFLTHSKQYLINRAFAEEVFRIPAELAEALGGTEIPDAETFLQTFQSHAEGCRGISFQDGKVTFTLPTADAPDMIKAFTHLAAAMVQQARASWWRTMIKNTTGTAL